MATADTSPRAVEALAREHEGSAEAPYTPPTTALWHRETADTLRALSALAPDAGADGEGRGDAEEASR